ncbi:unnamed protein product [Phytomonas sp. EM1]|nr:unnamed protein product [Phytomonas sp. EM1]|eukprot:CCW65375.1 unnamed protein product [Phytomonas sp. isolate EM1]
MKKLVPFKLFGCNNRLTSFRRVSCSLNAGRLVACSHASSFTRQNPCVLHMGSSTFHHQATVPRLSAVHPPQYQCSECGKSFRLLNALNHHILTKHAGQAKALVNRDGKVEEVAVTPPATQGSPSSTTVGTVPQPSHLTMPMTGSGDAPGGFPGFFAAPLGGSTFQQPAVTASAVPSSSQLNEVKAAHKTEPSALSDTSDDDADKRRFVCTICQKTFRLEAALQHHYQAKHNMEMPLSTSGTASSSSASGESNAHPVPDAASVTSAVEDAEKASGNFQQYVRQQDGALPQAPQYHLDVAPDAPEEGDVAVHWRCVNHCVLMGTVQEIQEGYVFEDHVLQFTLVTDFAGPALGDPDKDFHTVRVYGNAFWKPFREQLEEGDHCMVTGRLRMVPQFDASMKKYYHYPILQVEQGTGCMMKL